MVEAYYMYCAVDEGRDAFNGTRHIFFCFLFWFSQRLGRRTSCQTRLAVTVSREYVRGILTFRREKTLLSLIFAKVADDIVVASLVV